MTHKTNTIECNEREAYILGNATRFVSVIKLGRGQEDRVDAHHWDKDSIEARSRAFNKGVTVYAVGLSPEGVDAGALAAVYIPGKSGGWKFAEGFNPHAL